MVSDLKHYKLRVLFRIGKEGVHVDLWRHTDVRSFSFEDAKIEAAAVLARDWPFASVLEIRES